MKKVLLILALISVTAFGYTRMLVGIEAGGGYLIKENDNHPFVEGSVLINIHNNFYVRSEFARISFLSGNTHIKIGTMSPVDLMMFFESQTFNPYALAGINLCFDGGSTNFDARVGGGLEFKLNDARFFPFVEGIFDLNMYNNAVSSTHHAITLKGGIRVK